MDRARVGIALVGSMLVAAATVGCSGQAGRVPGADAGGSDAHVGPDAPPNGSSVTFTPVVIPLSDPELANPMRGSYQWSSQTPEPDGWPILDSYNRYTWKQLEPERDVYDFSAIDRQLAIAGARHGKFGMRIMPACSGCGSNSDAMPPYMHDLMPNGWWFGSNYAPDWNDPDYIDRLGKLLAALAAHVADDPRFGFFDVSCYGDWGEWHVFSWPYPGPTGATNITDENARAIVDLNLRTFPNTRLVMPHDHDVALAHAMSLSPRIGVRNDCLGKDWFTTANTQEAPVIGERWMTAPFITEYCRIQPGTGGLAKALGQTTQFHVAMASNGNIAELGSFSAEEQAAFVEANKRAGYRFELRGVTLPAQLGAGNDFTVVASWANVGVTPAYTPWDVELALLGEGTLTPVWMGVSTLDLEALLPSTDRVDVTDHFTLPSSVPAGTYRLAVTVRDRDGYYAPLALAIEGRDPGGSYALGDVTVR